MIYELALLVLVAATLLKKASRPFAFVLAYIWLLDSVAAHTGHQILIPWVDALGVYPLTYLVWNNPKWWSVSCAALSLICLPIHLWFWTGWATVTGFGEAYASVYGNVQCSVFLVSVVVLLMGNYDLAEFARGVLERARSLFDDAPAFARLGVRPRQSLVQEASVDGPVSFSHNGVGNRLSGRYRGWRIYDEAKAP